MRLFTSCHNQTLRLIISFFIGACGVLSFSPYDIWPAAIISLSGLIALIINRNHTQAALLGFIWGCGFFSTGINWIYIIIKQFCYLPELINLVIIIVLFAYLSIYPMLFAILVSIMYFNTNLTRMVLGVPITWLIIECFRGWIITGFPWLEFGYSQIDGPLKGLAPLLGVQGITFLLVLISSLIVFALLQKQFILILVAMVLFLISWSLSLIQWYELEIQRTVSVAIVQGNITQSIKWASNQIRSTLDIYLKHTISNIDKAQIIIWPETAIADNEISQNLFLTQLDNLLRLKHTNLITGIIGVSFNQDNYNYYNSILVLGGSKPYHYDSKERYDKHHLVPFGEIIPFRYSLQFILNKPIFSFNKGKYFQSQLKVSDIKFTSAICYEIILGKQIRDNFQSDTDFLLTISNDTWFGNSIGPWQHIQMARMRALELGRPLLHSTNNGITAVINADGLIQAQLPQFTSDVLNVYVTPTRGLTPYARFGSIPLLIVMLLAVIYIFLSSK